MKIYWWREPLLGRKIMRLIINLITGTFLPSIVHNSLIWLCYQPLENNTFIFRVSYHIISDTQMAAAAECPINNKEGIPAP